MGSEMKGLIMWDMKGLGADLLDTRFVECGC